LIYDQRAEHLFVSSQLKLQLPRKICAVIEQKAFAPRAMKPLSPLGMIDQLALAIKSSLSTKQSSTGSLRRLAAWKIGAVKSSFDLERSRDRRC
jgi:hypothetical protein